METKKNPKVDLSKNSSLYFVIGLAFILLISWQAIEWKTYEKDLYGYESLDVDEEEQEEIPITEQLQTPPPPPPPPAAPEQISVVEDEEEVVETVIESTESDQETEIVKVEDIAVEEVDEDVEVPFSIIEDVPVFPGCEKGTKMDKRNCFQLKMEEHVAKNFRYPEQALDLGIQGKVFVIFVIDKDGFVSSIRSRGPDKILEKEAERIIGLLPKMIPGKQRGKPVKVPYSVPIIFKYMAS